MYTYMRIYVLICFYIYMSISTANIRALNFFCFNELGPIQPAVSLTGPHPPEDHGCSVVLIFQLKASLVADPVNTCIFKEGARITAKNEIPTSNIPTQSASRLPVAYRIPYDMRSLKRACKLEQFKPSCKHRHASSPRSGRAIVFCYSPCGFRV